MKTIKCFIIGLFSALSLASSNAMGGTTNDAEARLSAITKRKTNKTSKTEDKGMEAALKELIAVNAKILALKGKITTAVESAKAIDGAKKKAAKSKAEGVVTKLRGEMATLRETKQKLTVQLGLDIKKTTGNKTTKAKTKAVAKTKPAAKTATKTAKKTETKAVAKPAAKKTVKKTAKK